MIVSDFCALAIEYRLKIFEIIRSNNNINHPAKDVLKALDLLVVKIDKFKERNAWQNDCADEPHSPLGKFIYSNCEDGGYLNSSELISIRKNLELALVKGGGYDDEFFRDPLHESPLSVR